MAAAHDGGEAAALDAQLRFDDGFIRDSRQCSRAENEEAVVATVDDEGETAATVEDEIRVTTVGVDDHAVIARGDSGC